ncbi:hypothetical protein LSTR_LSTR014305 [Laodelphax striatellus]|uniref:Uncharacterized protein n=1 Tax=Laodelphax striatellus TaxID=195883 RepID=A0A482WVP8_LAOST|nr:hypothetical protein LSTR_LSTR014305 [Laodelphax striatellus]
MKNDPKIYRITDVLVRWLRILQTKWEKCNYPAWLNWGSLTQLPANHKLLCDCRFELNKLILKLLFEAANLFSNESHRMKHEEKRCLETMLDRGIALIFAAAIGEDRSLSIEPGEIEAHYEQFVHTLFVCSELNVSAIQRKNLKHLAVQELKDPEGSGDEDDQCTQVFRRMCTF